MKNLVVLTILLCGAFSFKSCKEECSDPTNPDCENFDPCHGRKPANADFTINEQIERTDFYYETDTIYQTNGTLFKPKYDADSITWLLGSEKIHEKELYRRGYPEGWIEVTMIARMNPSACLTEQQRVDTLTKKFFVVPLPFLDSTAKKTSPWWGTWEGYNTDQPNDRFTISWGYIYKTTIPDFNIAEMDFVGLPKGIKKQIPFYTNKLSRSSEIEVGVGYKALRLYSISEDHWIGGGFALDGICYRDGNNVRIEYSYNNTPYQHWLNGEQRHAEPIMRVNNSFIATKISNQILTEE